MADNSSSNWSGNDPRMQSSFRNVQYPLSSALSILSPPTSFPYSHLPQSWIQFMDGEDKSSSMENFKRNKYLNCLDVKQEEFLFSSQLLYNGPNEASLSPTNKSCIATSNGSVLNLSNNKVGAENHHHHHLDQQSSPECNSARGGGISKKARFSSLAQPPFKARKEKLGDRITALHQLVSPFGKTDTASVLLEAIGYIRFLQTQIEALSSPYLATGKTQQQNDGEGRLKDLRSRGLCLVPVSRVG